MNLVFRYILLVLLVPLFFLVACSTSKQQPVSPVKIDYAALQQKAENFVPALGTYGGELSLSCFSGPKSFNPVITQDAFTSELTSYLYEGLVHINSVTLKPEPGLAESWTVSPDGLTWIFTIRKGVRWSDNMPFSAHDVAFTFNSIVLNESISPNSSRDLFVINGKVPLVKVLDSTKVQFTLPIPFAPFLRAMSHEILPEHVLKAAVKTKNFAASLSLSTPVDSMIGTGPFLLESYIPLQKITFKRNPLYWRKDAAGNTLPYLSRIVYHIVMDQGVEISRFKQGELDYLKAKGEDFDTLTKYQAKGNYTVYRLGPVSGSYFILFNQNTGIDTRNGKHYVDSVKLSWFRNQKFRQAIAYALDKETMIKTVMNGLGIPQWGAMSPSDGYFYNPNVATYSYDTAKAKAMLAEAGFTDKNKDGILEDSKGHPVEFSFITNSGNIVRGKLAEIICKNLTALGCKVQFQYVDFTNLISRIDNPPYEWDAALLGLSGSVEPHMGKNVWHSKGALHMWFPNQTTPPTLWEASIDSIFDAGYKELDEQKRKALYDEWQRIVSEQLPFIYTVLPEQLFCIANKFKNVNPSVTGGLLHTLPFMFVDTLGTTKKDSAVVK